MIAPQHDRIGNPNAAHLYEVYTSKGVVEVDADSRDQARRIAEASGYDVRAVNMVG